MKKIASILVILFAFILTTQAQKGKKKMKFEKFSVEQQTTLAVKKMTLALDLTTAQQRQIEPIIAKKVADRKANKKTKKAKKDRKKLTADERYAKANKRLDMQIEMKKKMKSILNKEQFEKFEKMHKRRKMKGKKMMKKRKDRKKRKETKEEKH